MQKTTRLENTNSAMECPGLKTRLDVPDDFQKNVERQIFKICVRMEVKMDTEKNLKLYGNIKQFGLSQNRP